MSNLQDYELAALALDAYQRGYHAGMPDLASRLNDGLGSTYLTPVAGGVVIASSSETLAPGVDQAADFYAIAYQIGNEVIIAYRGSDNLNWQIIDDLAVPMGGADASSVVDIAQGIVEDQTRLAFEFYHAVKAANPGKSITLTGHSLGGALAGIVAGATGTEAVLFSNTAFEPLTEDILEALSDPLHVQHQDMVDMVWDGQILSPPTSWNIRTVSIENDVAGLAYRNSQVTAETILNIGYEMSPVDAHMQAILVLSLHAEATGLDASWKLASQYVVPFLSDTAIAIELGIVGVNNNPASGVMKDMIASTVLPGYSNPFGDTAADILLHDMANLGKAISHFSSPTFSQGMFDALGSLFVLHAGAVAVEGLFGWDFMLMPYDGLSSYFGNTFQLQVSPYSLPWELSAYDFNLNAIINATIQHWGSGSMRGTSSIPFSGDVWSQILSIASEATSLSITADASFKGDGVLIGDGDNTSLTGGNGNDIIIGAMNSSSISGGDGSNVLIGGSGNDQFILGHGDNIVDGGDGTDSVFLYGNAATTIQHQATISHSGMIDMHSGSSATILAAVEKLRFGASNDVVELQGGSGGIYSEQTLDIHLEAGNDILIGVELTSPLIVQGGEGSDVLVGGSGDDILYAGISGGSTSGNATSPSALNLVTDPSFEDCPHQWNPYGNYYEVYGFLFDSTTWDWVQYIYPEAQRGFVQVYQDQYDDWRNGLPTQQYAAISEGALSQTITTDMGTVYDLSWMMQSNWEYGLEVRWNGVLVFDELTPQQKLWEWESKSIQVIGTGNDILSFRVPSYEDVTYWVLLDEISLTATVSATNRLCGFLGDDILVGNSTTVDQFLYRAGMGNDTIRNFGSNDTILLDQSLGITWSNLKNLGVQDGADCYFEFDLENSLRIEDTNLASLDASQFISCDLTDTATLNALVQDWGDWLL